MCYREGAEGVQAGAPHSTRGGEVGVPPSLEAAKKTGAMPKPWPSWISRFRPRSLVSTRL